MRSKQAIQILGGKPATAAAALEASVQAVAKWPEVLPRRIADRVLGAYMRKNMPGLVESLMREAANQDSVSGSRTGP